MPKKDLLKYNTNRHPNKEGKPIGPLMDKELQVTKELLRGKTVFSRDEPPNWY